MSARIQWPIPAWLDDELPAGPLASEEARMRLAIRLSERNVDEGTGSPFGAVLCEAASGRPVALGVDLGSSTGCSVAHAEIVAIARAQAAHGDLRAAGPLALYTSATPCTMCLGAILWSGIARITYGARDEDWNTVWDDLPKAPDWPAQMAARGVAVTGELLRGEACRPLSAYFEARR